MTSPRPRTLVVMGNEAWDMQFDDARRARLRELADTFAPMWAPTFESPTIRGHLADVEVLLTGWGTPRLTADRLARLPGLRAVLHCAGTVRGLVGPELWQRGILVSTSADLNADPVAEYTLAAVIMAGKKAPFLAADARRHREDWSYRRRRCPRSNLGPTIGIVGFSRIGRRVISMLTRTLHDVTCLVADPYATPREVSRAGARLVDLDEMLPALDILSLHAPALPETRRMIGAPQLAALPDHSCVINTARGSLVDTAALEAECATGRLHAILDVTDPEPLPGDARLYDLPNVMITPHIAGSLDSETMRMADGALDELERLAHGQPLARAVSRAALTHSA
ncbi:hydroxyacid dehydrogenase [Streptomyces sp. NPDC088812]|uniref:hydroxyacid dehydrogenase n=1 Tax=Streptomyces sp. NPDC088812 TaxID=3365905 RepID=UPI0037FC990D